MRSWLSLGAQHEPSTTALSSVLLVCSFLTTHAAIPKHSLATWAASWLLAWLFSQVRKAGLEPSFVDGTRRKRLCWAAGLLIVLKQICERVVGDYDELRWTKAFLPPAIILLRSSGLMSSTSVEHSSTDPLSRGSKQLIIIATATACLALGPLSTSPPTITLGLCSILLTCLASYAIEEALRIASDEKSASNGGFVSADGSLSRIRPMSNSSNIILVSLSDVSCVATVGCTIAAIIFEPVQHDGLVFERQWDKLTGDHWRTQQVALDVVHGATITVAGTIRAFLMLSLIQRRGALSVGFIDLGAGLCSSLVSSLTIIRVYWTLLSATSLALLSGESGSSEYVAGVSRRRMRLKQLLTLLSVLSFGVLTVLLLRNRHDFAPTLPESPSDSAPTATPPQPSRASDLKQHPIYQLINKAEKDFETTKSKQSKTLGEAVAEYRRRYQLPPPPHFDKWYEFAKKRDVRLIDEYDTIFHSLQPFWGIDPATIRARTREALGFRNALMGVAIRRGQVTLVEGGVEWLQKATVGMVQEFVGHLPDMDLAFNTHDEPRVVVPHDDLKRLLDIAKTETMAAAFANAAPKDSFSNRPRYLTNGENFREFKTTRFNRYAHQPTWVPSRLSCSPDTPARSLHENPPDNTTSWALDDLSLIHNATAFSDICLSPSLHETFGFFDRPNAFDVVHELFPVFSQSKVSSFQDILYPSPWYWYDKVKYDEAKDVDWEKKESKLYWRGSTTGGFSRDGGWRRQHRQNVVKRFNALDTADVLQDVSTDPSQPSWSIKHVKRNDYAGLFDVHFSHIGQCDPGDCDAQREFFSVAKPADQQEAWHSRFLLDMDGNAFSGRFYAFLKSKSLVYKMAIFREWHNEWLRPWVHYIPLSLRGDEYVESVRYFAGEPEGKEHAPRLGVQGREWANRVLRNEDFEVWFFRLLLEYARVIDDHRETIGYGGS